VQTGWDIIAHTSADKGAEFGFKQAMILNIMQHYNVQPECFKNSILFDDQIENLTSAHDLGLGAVQASPECAGRYCDLGCGLQATASRAL
jgi:hypothetical protein